jgi:hypothetical protein
LRTAKDEGADHRPRLEQPVADVLTDINIAKESKTNAATLYFRSGSMLPKKSFRIADDKFSEP